MYGTLVDCGLGDRLSIKRESRKHVLAFNLSVVMWKEFYYLLDRSNRVSAPTSHAYVVLTASSQSLHLDIDCYLSVYIRDIGFQPSHMKRALLASS